MPKIVQALEGLPDRLRERNRRNLRDALDLVESRIKQACPVRTGKLRDSIRVKVEGSGDQVRGTIAAESNLPHVEARRHFVRDAIAATASQVRSLLSRP